MHYEQEEVILKNGCLQKNLWGGGIDTDLKIIDYNSFINIRPKMNNPSNEILDLKLRKKLEKNTKYFFKKLYD